MAERFLERLHALAGAGADGQFAFAAGDGAQVAFVEDGEMGKPLLFKALEQGAVLVRHARGRVHHQYGDVGAVQLPQGAPDAQRADLALVVEAGSVDHHHRPEGQKFHGLAHRVGGGARHGRDDGHALPGEGVDEAGLAGVAPPEKGDVYALGGGGSAAVCHGKPPLMMGRGGHAAPRFFFRNGSRARPARSLSDTRG